MFIMGVGVAGLQAIATARRLGGVVTATDVRPATKEQVESLGAKFVAVQNDEFKEAETKAGYAKEMSDDYKRQQAELVAEHIAKQDIVDHHRSDPRPACPEAHLGQDGRIDEARLGHRGSGRRARRQLRTDEALGEVFVTENGVKILGTLNLAGKDPGDVLAALCQEPPHLRRVLRRQREQGVSPSRGTTRLVKATLLTKDGKLVHPTVRFGSAGGLIRTHPT